MLDHYNLVTLAVIVPYIFFINVEVASINLVLLFCIPVVSKILGKYIRIASKRVLDSYNSSVNVLNDNYKNWAFVRLFNCYYYCKKRFDTKNKQYKVDIIHQNFLYFVNSGITLTIQFLGTVVIWVVGAKEIMIGHMTIGTITALMSYQAIITSPIIYIASFSNNYHTALISLKDLYDLLEYQNSDDKDIEKISPFNEPIKSIILEDLTYSYSTSTQPVFQHLNAHFYAGKVYIVSGKSGQGKSTLFKVLSGLIDANKGRILINSRSMNTIRHQDYWNQLGYVLQRSQFFEDSIIRNIDVNGDLDMTVVQEVCKRLDLYQDIVSLPKKWETIIESDYANFSEGQLRRLDIARTVLKSASVVIFDEVTANIDDNRKKQFYKLVRCLADEGKIVILATHNSNEIQYADVVYSLSVDGLKEEHNENRSN
jgi:ABC-type bacteriocin/lantibiotic exporter with double-glycine peptidase domain